MIRSRQRPRVDSGSRASASLALRLDFLSSTSLDPRVTFSRGTNATMIDSTGKLTFAPSNQIPNSESFTATTWAPTGLNATTPVVSNATVAPDGTTTADSIVEINGGAASTHRIDYSGLAGNAGKYAVSVYLKAGTKTSARLQFDAVINAVTSSCAVQINLTDGTPSATTAVGNIATATATSEAVGNGWYRVGLIFTISPVYVLSGGSVRIYLMQSLSGNPTYVGDGSNIFVWGAQFGAMTYETAPRAYNSTTPKNLLGRTEEFDNAAWAKANSYVQTNLLLYSEQLDNAAYILTNINTPTANAGVSPNGTTSADKIIGNTTASSHIITQTGVASATLGTTYTTSVYIKASGYGFAFVGLNGTAYTSAPYISVNLTDGSFFTTNGTPSSTSVTNAGNGWYRVSISGATTVAASAVQLDVRPSPDGVWANRNNAQNGTDGILAWGAQLVQGATAGDYQQTLATAAPVQYTAPNGYLNADKIVANNTSGTHSVGQNLTVVSGQILTASVYVKAAEYNFGYVLLLTTFAAPQIFAINLTTGDPTTTSGSPLATSVTNAGNGWWRISITQITNAAGTATMQIRPSPFGTTSGFTGDDTSGIYVWGAQLSDSASLDPYVYNPAAAITSAAYYGPRFDYDPNYVYSTDNLIPYAYPQDFSNAAFWFKPRATAVATTATADPFGTYTAYKLTEDLTPNSTHLIQWQGANVSVKAGVQYTFSGYVKQADALRPIVQLQLGTDNNAFVQTACNFDMSTGVLATTIGPGIVTVVSAGNGWYRWSLTQTAIATANAVMRVFILSSTGAIAYDGNGTSGIYIWGAQLTASAAAVPFFYYPSTSLGLLIEEARTNLQTYSEQFDNLTSWTLTNTNTPTANAIIAPDGTITADKVIPNATLSVDHLVNSTVSTALNTQYTVSVYAKAAGYSYLLIRGLGQGASGGAVFDILNGVVINKNSWTSASVTAVGAGWYRCVVTGTTGATAVAGPILNISNEATYTTAFSGDGVSGAYLWGAQMEVGAFATSYIPTAAASVTRSADIATMVGNNFTNWYNEASGTISTSADTVAPSGTPTAILSFQDAAGSSTNRHQLSLYSNCAATVLSGITQASIGLNTLQTLKAAYGYQDNNFGFSANGGTVALDTLGTVPLSIGYATLGRWDYGVNATINGHIKSISYYNTRLPDAQLQAITL